jgi:teichoic acid transport system permease protein
MSQTAVADTGSGLSPAELARRHGLSAAGRLPSLLEYARSLWVYRHFISAFARARVSAALGDTHLGTLWQVLTPLINAGVYYFIFGILIDTRRSQHHFIAYLCIGVFIFGFSQAVTQSGVQAITSNLGLIRALHFPRASLPIATAFVEIRNILVSMLVLIAIVLFSGEPITVRWLLILPALLLQSIFNCGMAMFVSRLGTKFNDIKQLIPFIMRIWMYLSAVIYPVTNFTEHLHGWKLRAVEANPMLVFIELIRHALMSDVKLAGSPMRLWTEALVWAVMVGFGGFVYFWRGERDYGRG